MMNLTELHRKLIAAARRDLPDGRVPYAFEKRIIARLPKPAAPDQWGWWSRALWRSAAACLAVVLLLGALSWFAPTPARPANGLSEEFESTMLAVVSLDADTLQ